jgi:hypothetical protein
LATWEKWADNRRVRFFYIRRIIARALQWVGHDGDTFGYAGSYFPVRQPCHVPAHPIWRWEAGVYHTAGGRIMRHIFARPEPVSLPQNLTSFVNRALHDASLASTPNAAIDLLADALLALAVLAHPMEGRQHD